MEAEIKDHFQADVQLIAGSGGVYDIVADGKEIFSKHKAGRFPQPNEIITLIKTN